VEIFGLERLRERQAEPDGIVQLPYGLYRRPARTIGSILPEFFNFDLSERRMVLPELGDLRQRNPEESLQHCFRLSERNECNAANRKILHCQRHVNACVDSLLPV
jgi:hypothetical protein